MPREPRSFLLCASLLSTTLAALAASGAAAAEPLRIEVAPLENGSALATGDIAVLDTLVVSALSELPLDRFAVAAGKANADPACDKPCRIETARARGAARLVIGSVAAFGDGFLAAFEAYDAETGQLLGSATTGAVGAATDLLAAIRTAAAELRGKIDPAPAASPPPATPKVIAIVEPRAATATLRVETVPSGATVYIQRIGNRELVGTAPLEKTLLPLDYRVIAKLPEHAPASAEVRLDPFERELVRLVLQRVYPTSPAKRWGHAAFWPGIAVTVFGFGAMAAARDAAREYEYGLRDSARDNARSWTAGMWAGFGLGVGLMTTGIVLWAATPSSKEHWEETHGKLAIAPTPDGGAVAAYGRRF
jgi:hypothetical protein